MGLIPGVEVPGTLEDLVAEIKASGGGATPVRCDLLEAGQVDALVEEAERRLGWPETRVSRASMIRPERFSIRPWPMKQSFASMPGPLR